MIIEKKETKPVAMNAFELISLSQGLNLSSLFETKEIPDKKETRFTSKKPAKEILSTIEDAAKPLGFNIQKKDYKMKLQGDKLGRKGYLSVSTEVFEVTPSLFMVELQKDSGDTLEYNHFYKNLSKGLKDIVWKAEPVESNPTSVSDQK